MHRIGGICEIGGRKHCCHGLSARVSLHPHYGVFYREVLERLPPQRHLSVGASGSFRRLRDEYSNQRIQAVKTDYQEDGNKSHDCKKVRSSFLFIPVPEKETFFRRGFLLCFSDLWNVAVYLEH